MMKAWWKQSWFHQQWQRYVACWDRLYFKTPYQLRRTPITLLAMITWMFMGAHMWLYPLPLTLYPAFVDPATRSDGHYIYAGLVIATGAAMVIGQLGSWTCIWAAKTWWYGLGFAVTEAAILLISTCAAVLRGIALWPQAGFALVGWAVTFGFLLLARFTVKRLIMEDGIRYE